MTEEAWHDKQVHKRRTTSDFYDMGALRSADTYTWQLLGDMSDKRVVDFGCGQGHNAVRMAKQGAVVYAFDISSAMIEMTKQNAMNVGLENRVFAEKMPAEQLAYPDKFVDLVFGHSILHHTDLALTRREIHRILKPGGRAVFLEPLDHNPFIRLFRQLTPSRRTPTEQPLRFEDVFFFSQLFSSFHHREFYLVALMAFPLLPLGKEKLFQFSLENLGHLDDILLSRWPSLGKYAWVIVMELTK